MISKQNAEKQIRSPVAGRIRLALYAMAVGNFAVGTGALMIAGLVPDIADAFSVSDALSGQLIMIYALIYALMAPVLGIATSSLSKRTILIIAAVGLAVTNLLAALATSFWWLMAARGASALFAALLTPVAATVATMLVPQERAGQAIGIVFGGFAVSTVIGVPAGALIGGYFGWSAAFYLVSGLSVLALILICLGVPGGLATAKSSFKELLNLLRHRKIVLAVSLTAFQIGANFVPFTYAAVLFENAFEAGPVEIFWLLTAFGAASVIGNHVGGVLTDKLGSDRVIWYGLLFLPLPLAALYAVPSGLVVSLLVMAVWGGVAFTYTAPQQVRLVSLDPGARSLLLSLNASCIYLGTMAGSVVGGVLLTYGGSAWLPAGGVIIAILGILVYWWGRDA